MHVRDLRRALAAMADMLTNDGALLLEIADDVLDAAGFAIYRRDQYQPIASSREAKLVHTLGFEQCAPAYLTEINAPPAHIDAHRRYLNRILGDQRVTIALFNNTQILARRR